MARQLRPDFPGAVHHVTSRGHQRRNIFRKRRDYERFLELLGETVQRYGWVLTAYVLMTNHYHLVMQTREANFSDGMQWLNARYVQYFNKKYGRCNALFGDRPHSFLVDSENYLTEVIRYVVLNPVRAKMVARPEEYRWSSYNATAGLCAPPEWLALVEAKPYFGSDEAWQKNYIDYVSEKIGSDERIWTKIKRRIYLGSDEWIAKLAPIVASKMPSDVHPREQREIGMPTMQSVMKQLAESFKMRMSDIRDGRGGDARMAAAWIGWNEGLLRLREIAAALRLRSQGRISDLVRMCEHALARDSVLRERVAKTVRRLPMVRAHLA